MNARNILGIVTAFFVFVAVSGHTTASHKKYSAYFSGAHQKVNDRRRVPTAAEPRLQRPYGILAEIDE